MEENETFVIFGNGLLGKKAEDLKNHAELIDDFGMKIPKSIIISIELFNRFLQHFNLNEQSFCVEVEKMECPEFFLSINEKILTQVEPRKPYILRSSEITEEGGIGIYESVFFWPTGNKEDDLKKLWQSEVLVYQSEFSADARLWRGSRNVTEMGMAILMQPVIGSAYREENTITPLLSGTAYTSYHGSPIVRVVLGLGTKAVNGGGIVFNSVPEKEYFEKVMLDQEYTEIFTPSGMQKIKTSFEKIYFEIGSGYQEIWEFFGTLKYLKEETGGDFYLEWIIHEGKTYVVQIAPHKDKPFDPTVVPFDSKDFSLLLEGTDTVQPGKASCKSIVLVQFWSHKEAQALEYLNKNTKDYLLILPQDAFSQLASLKLKSEEQKVGFRHFSNSLAVVEMQHAYTEEERLMYIRFEAPVADHSSGGKGATHFLGVCEKSDILFLGTQNNLSALLALPGGFKYREESSILIWNIPTEIVIENETKRGYVYVSNQYPRNEYSIFQLENWADYTRSLAIKLDNDSTMEIAEALYIICYAIAPYDSENFDPFKWNKDNIDEYGGEEGFKKILKLIIDRGHDYIDHVVWNNGLKNYLQDLHDSITITV